jgi:hypothetical protein
MAAQDSISTSSPFSIDVLSLQAAPPRAQRSVAEGASIRIRGFGVFSETNGTIDFGDSFANVESEIDLAETLGMDTEKFTGGGLIGFTFGSQRRWHLDFSYLGFYEFEGSRNVGSISWNDEIYVGQVDSKARIHEGAVSLGFDFWRPGNVTLTAFLAAHMFYVEAEIEEQLTGRNNSVQFFAPVPVLGGSLRWDLTPNVYVSGSAGGIYAGDVASFFDLSAEFGVDFTENWGVFIGYRFWDLQIEWDDDEYDFDNGAVYAGVEYRL